MNSDGSINVEENWHLAESNSSVISANLQMKNLSLNDVSDLKVFRESGSDVIDFVFVEYAEDNIKTGNYSIVGSGDDLSLICGIGRYNDFTISYKVNDKVTLYNDCADLQLELLDRSKGIVVNSIKGEIYYPSKVQKTAVINAWEKHSNVNSELNDKDEEKVIFTANEIDESGVRVRVLMPNSMFSKVTNTISELKQDAIISEENNDVFASNAKNTIFNGIISLIAVVVLVVMLMNSFKYIKEYGKVFTTKPTVKVKYSKELPFNGITPGQAAYIKDINKAKMGDIFAATLLNMKMKGTIDIIYVGEKNNLENTFIKLVDMKPVLTVEEAPVFDFLLECMEKFQKTDFKISLNMLRKYIEHTSSVVSKLKTEMKEAIKHSISSYDVQADKRISRRTRDIFIYLAIFVVMLLIPSKLFGIFALRMAIYILAIINIIFCSAIVLKTNIFDQEGINNREKLKAFERYMIEFANFKNKGVPEISIWEYYIIFAMAFGISNKVLEQIVASYPNIEDTSFIDSYMDCMNLNKCNFKKSFLLATSGE